MSHISLPVTHQHLRLPDIPDGLLKYKDWLEANAKPAWLLRAIDVEQVDGNNNFLGGHTPYQPEGETWPVCPHCQREMGFVMQVALSDDMARSIPSVKVGTFQFWNCWFCVPAGDIDSDSRRLVTYSEGEFSDYGSSCSLV